MRGFRSLDEVARSMLILGVVVASFGAALIVGPGYLNPWRFWRFFVIVGLGLFFAPGVASAAAGFFLPRRQRAAWTLGVVASAAQLAIAAFLFAVQFFVTPLSLVPLVLGATWAAASGAILVGLVRYRHQMTSDATARGFAVDFSPTERIDRPS